MKNPASSQTPFLSQFFARIFFVKKQKDPNKFFTECAIYVFLLLWGLTFFKDSHLDVSRYGFFDAIAHNVDLIFHEAGHLVFSFFGVFIEALGGTLMQCLVPIIVMLYFLRKKENFSAAVGLWWLGQNFLDVAPYIYDAWDRALPMISQHGKHDWHFILGRLNRLDQYAEISAVVAKLGRLAIFLSLSWGGVVFIPAIPTPKKTWPKKPLGK